jgi:hypothetical protein
MKSPWWGYHGKQALHAISGATSQNAPADKSPETGGAKAPASRADFGMTGLVRHKKLLLTVNVALTLSRYACVLHTPQ